MLQCMVPYYYRMHASFGAAIRACTTSLIKPVFNDLPHGFTRRRPMPLSRGTTTHARGSRRRRREGARCSSSVNGSRICCFRPCLTQSRSLAAPPPQGSAALAGDGPTRHAAAGQGRSFTCAATTWSPLRPSSASMTRLEAISAHVWNLLAGGLVRRRCPVRACNGLIL